MSPKVRGGAIALLVAFLALSASLAGIGPRTPDVAVAGGVRTTAAPGPLILNVTPWNGQTIGSATPVISVLYLDPNPSATIVAVDFHLDGMNLTSAGMFNDTVFALPLALELRSGPHFAAFALVDSFGGSNATSWTFTVDTFPPILLVTSPAYPMIPAPAVFVNGTARLVNESLFGGAAPINVTATALPSGVRRWAYPVDGPFSILLPLSEGVNTIFVNATDRVGNFATQIVNVIRDTVRPVLVVRTPVNLSVSPTSYVRVSGLSEFGAYLTVNGYAVAVAPNGTWSVVLALPDGLNILQIAAADQVGNLNYAGVAVFVDSDVPQVTLSAPTAALTNQNRVVVEGTATDSKLVALLVNGMPVSWNATGGFGATLALPDGNDPIVVVAVDAAQRMTIVQRRITVDTTPPVVSVTSPPDGLETNQSTAIVRGAVNDPDATVLVNGQTIRPGAGGQWQTTVALVVGGNTVLVSAVDAAGNRAATVPIRIEYFSPVPDLENRTDANAANLEAMAGFARLSLAGILVLALAVEFALYARVSRKLRENRRILAAVVRVVKKKP